MIRAIYISDVSKFAQRNAAARFQFLGTSFFSSSVQCCATMNDRVVESAIDHRAARIRNCRIADGACTFLDESSRYAARLDADEGVEMTMVGLNREQRRIGCW